MIRNRRKRSPSIPLKRPDASPEVLRAVGRYRVALPEGEPHEVDRAVIATLLSFGSHLDHDPALSGALALLERTRETLRKLLPRCQGNHDVQIVHRVCEQLADASDALRKIEPVGIAGVRPQFDPHVDQPRRDPSPDEIAAACADIRAGLLRTPKSM